jgi:ATP-dependent RNA helicase DDX49/DBP8
LYSCIGTRNFYRIGIETDSSMSSFSSLLPKCSDQTLKAIKSMSIFTPTDIQAKVIPLILSDHHVLCASPTGTGKTLAYVLPIIYGLSKDPYGMHTLILVPVRELGSQIKAVIESVTNNQFQVLLITGGRSLTEQSKLLSTKPHIVIATPGRLAEIIRSDDQSLKTSFKNLKYFVIDEIDKVLIKGFEQDLQNILEILPDKHKRVNLFFSATISSAVEKLKESYGNSLYVLDHTENSVIASPSTITHKYSLIPSSMKLAYLVYLIESESLKKGQMIIFTSNIKQCQIIGDLLWKLNDALKLSEEEEGAENRIYKSSTLHSLLPSQVHRDRALNLFRNKKCRILVATDVACRGIDIPNVETVINFDLPRDSSTKDDYVHRAGRTGRAGKRGLVISLISENETTLKETISDFDLDVYDEFSGTVEKAVIKKLGKIAKLKAEIEVRLHETGFDGNLENRKKQRSK